MERLEEAIEHLDDILSQPNREWSCQECKNEHIKLREWLKELKGYRDLEKKGLLLKLPCKVGDMFFCIWMNKGQNPIQKMQVKKIEIHERKGMVFQMEFVSNRGCLFRFYADDFGKTVFLTRAEAEEALREIRAVQARNGGF